MCGLDSRIYGILTLSTLIYVNGEQFIWKPLKFDMRTELFRVITQRVAVTSHRRFGTDVLSRNVHHSLRNNQEERSSHILRDGNLKFTPVGWSYTTYV